MSPGSYSLARLGWRAFHSQQLRLEDLDAAYPARVSSVHRSGLSVISERGAASVSVPHRITEAEPAGITVGDWVLVENDALRVARLIKPHSAIVRTAAGTEHRQQAI